MALRSHWEYWTSRSHRSLSHIERKKKQHTHKRLNSTRFRMTRNQLNRLGFYELEHFRFEWRIYFFSNFDNMFFYDQIENETSWIGYGGRKTSYCHNCIGARNRTDSYRKSIEPINCVNYNVERVTRFSIQLTFDSSNRDYGQRWSVVEGEREREYEWANEWERVK